MAISGLAPGPSVRLGSSRRVAEAAYGPARRLAWPRADLRADLRAASRSRVRTCVRLCAGRILRPPPPSVPLGSALSRMVKFGRRNETRPSGSLHSSFTPEGVDTPEEFL